METPKWPKRFLPFEQTVLTATCVLLNETGQRLLVDQIASVNKIQRILQWNEINLYSMRWFKVQWPSESLFRDTGEFDLATVLLRAGNVRVKVVVWSVGGHIFQFHSPTSMKQLRAERQVEVENSYAGHHQYKAAI